MADSALDSLLGQSQPKPAASSALDNLLAAPAPIKSKPASSAIDSLLGGSTTPSTPVAGAGGAPSTPPAAPVTLSGAAGGTPVSGDTGMDAQLAALQGRPAPAVNPPVAGATNGPKPYQFGETATEVMKDPYARILEGINQIGNPSKDNAMALARQRGIPSEAAKGLGNVAMGFVQGVSELPAAAAGELAPKELVGVGGSEAAGRRKLAADVSGLTQVALPELVPEAAVKAVPKDPFAAAIKDIEEPPKAKATEATKEVYGQKTPDVLYQEDPAHKMIADIEAQPHTVTPDLKQTSEKVGKDVAEVFGGTETPVKRYDVNATDAEALIRSRIGAAERESKTTASILEPYMARVNAMSRDETLDFLQYVQGRSKGAKLKDAALQPVADALSGAFKLREEKLRELSSTSEMDFVTDYFPQMWKDPRKAAEFTESFTGVGKQGSGGSLKKRKYPTIADGLNAGLELKYNNPLEATTMYTANMDRYIATNQIFEAAREAKEIKYLTPGTQPEGWVQVNGRLGQKQTPVGPKVAYAPVEWARTYNNFISRGFAEIDPKLGNFVDNARKATNFVTATELGLSGFHALTMAQESMVSEVARAVGEAAGGEFKTAAGTLVKAPLAPVRLAMLGKKGQNIYLGKTAATGRDAEVIDALTSANARMTGMDKTLNQTSMGSFWTAWKRGSLKLELMEEAAKIKNAPGVTGKTMATASAAARGIARTMETVAAPLFEKYIPLVKNGAAMETMRSWLEMHPGASEAEKAAAARQIWDSIDNRFGELVQDNIFWNQTMKQAAQIGLRSYSWTLGTAREIGGGVLDIAKAPSKGWTPRASYVVALPMTYAFVNALYQGLKTGKAPESMQDLLSPKTGGIDPATNQPERAQLPSYMKDVLGWYEQGPATEAYNKLSTLPRVASELLTNKDWKGQPIAGPNPSEWLSNYFDYVTNNFGPISVRQAVQGRKEGSNISGPEGFLGIRPANRRMTDPEGYEAMMEKLHGKQWRAKQNSDARSKMYYGGTEQ